MYKNGIIITEVICTENIRHKKAKAEKKQKQRTPISSEWYYAIKWLAIICMVVDHTAKTIGTGWNDETLLMMRMIGRMAMPLFAWEIVQCFHFTENRKKHLLSIGLLAIISEVPYDKVIKDTWCTWDWQNVCFTFFLGWIAVWMMNIDWSDVLWKMGIKGKRFRTAASKLAGIAMCFPLFWLSDKLHVDYIWHGVGLVFLFEFAYRRKWRKPWEFIAIMAYAGSMGVELVPVYSTCFFCLIFMWLAEYDAKKPQHKRTFASRLLLSEPSKWICRLFYPAHLIVLGILNEVIR